MADLYEELGLGRTATEAAIKAAHRAAVKRTHPDKPGGDRAAFDRVQRAFGILSDQSRRQRYDETGVDSDVDPLALARAQAMTTVAGKMNAILSDPNVDPRHYDLVLGIRELIAQDLQGIRTNIAESRQMQERLRQFERRLKRKKPEKGEQPRHDPVGPLISAQIGAHAERIVALEDALKVLAMATELIEEYVYETDPAQQMVHLGNPARGIWSTY